METDPYDNTPKHSRLGRAARGSGGWLSRHPLGALQTLALLLLAIIVLQNLEPTSIRVLFWTVASLPQLVVILISMVLGAVVWEWVRRRWFRPRRKGATATSETRP